MLTVDNNTVYYTYITLSHCMRGHNRPSSINFLPARRYASAGYRDRNVSVRPSVRLSVCLSVRHAPVLCQNEES